jgi:hypothetical protein
LLRGTVAERRRSGVIAIRLDALATLRPHGRGVRDAGREVETVALTQLEVARSGVEHDRPTQAEQDLMLVVLVPRVSVAGAVRP